MMNTKLEPFIKKGMEYDLSEEKFEGSMRSEILGDNIYIKAAAYENINPY